MHDYALVDNDQHINRPAKLTQRFTKGLVRPTDYFRFNGSVFIAKFRFEKQNCHQICLFLATEQHVFLFVCYTKRV